MNVLILYDDLFFYLSTQKVVCRQMPLCCTLGIGWVTITVYGCIKFEFNVISLFV